MKVKICFFVGLVASSLLPTHFAVANTAKYDKCIAFIYQAMDTNGDGKINIAEYKAEYTPDKIKTLFTMKDTNNDKHLTKEELFHNNCK